MLHQFLLLALCASSGVASSPTLSSIDSCESGYTLCAPPDATTTTTPQIGDSSMQDLYVDILSSSLPHFKLARSLAGRGSASVCCISSLTCLTMSSLSIPFCYDKFTTNYFLPDGSYGTLAGGHYTSYTGDEANLQSGNYTLENGTTGNIYGSDEAKKPNTATLAIPSQYTAAGIGSAIPASALGGMITLTITTTLAASTQFPSTIPASTVPESTRTIASVYEPTETVTTVVSSQTIVTKVTGLATSSVTSVVPGTTVPATTLGLSTRESAVSVITTTVQTSVLSSASSGSASAATATTSKKSAGGRIGVPWLGDIFVGMFLGFVGGLIL